MSDLIKKTRKLFAEVNRTNQANVREYLIISDVGSSSIATESGLSEQMFRTFNPVSEYKGRKLNSRYGHEFNPFKDTLMDYPTIVRYKLDKEGVPWGNYNRLVSLHIARCPLKCWHCYIEECLKTNCSHCTAKRICKGARKKELRIKEDYLSAEKIVERFLEQRKIDKDKGSLSNILRITGGEPFLVPELLLEILENLKKINLDNEVFLWTETNLIPLIIKGNGKSLISDNLLNKLAAFQNFCVHPCFHGLSKNSFKKITGEKIKNFNFLINGLERLVRSGIDVYPTFGSNMTAPKEIEYFYYRISEIDRLLPLKFCLIEYDLDYIPVRWRREKIPKFAKRHKKVYDRFQIIDKWNELLIKNTGHKYGEMPRHLVPRKEGIDMSQVHKKTVHFFHRVTNLKLQRDFLWMIALPIGARGHFQYGKRWPNEIFIKEIENINKGRISEGILWILSSINTNFYFACPIRLVKILNVEYKDDNYYIHIIAQEYLSEFRKFDNVDGLKDFTKVEFGNPEIPCPGIEKGFVYIGPEIRIETTTEPSLENLHNVLQDISYPSDYQHDIKMADYPLLKIRTINKSKINKKGYYELLIDQEYKIDLSYYQGDDKRDREVWINEIKSLGKSVFKEISIVERDKNGNETNIEVKFDNHSSMIPLKVVIKIPITRNKWFPLITLILSTVFGGFALCFFLKLDNREILYVAVPLIVVILSTLANTITKRE